MKLVVTEKNDAAQKIADLLGVKKPKADKVYSTPVYRFDVDGEEWVTIGLRGHILEPDFAPTMVYKKRGGWQGVTEEGETLPAELPASLPKPPFKKKKPFTEDGVELKSWKMDALPYLVYAPINKLPKEKEIIRSLKNLAKKADSVIIATDFDREGELIGSDALSCIQEVNPTAPVSRARYSAFTKEEITHAFDNLVELDVNLASAGASRQDIDLIWGAVLTRYLTLVKFAGYGNVRSSGRVQTPTLALVVARERERLAFVPEDYWVIRGAFGTDPDAFEAPHATARFKAQAEAQAVMAHVEGATRATVASVEKKKRTVQPPAPFNTTSLMAAASAEGLSPARTMRIAESLYMDGYISYPRVDNTVYPSSLDLADTVKAISGNPAYAPYCKELLAKGKLTATRGKKETTDHPPIYPTAKATPDDLAPADYKLYNLIARRFLATLSEAAVIEGTKVTLDVNAEPFVAKGDVLVKPGYRAIYPYGLKKDEQLPALSEGSTIAFNGATCTKKQTEPPARYSQGKLVQEMEKLGLGTKSTRASIIERLYQVKYVQNDPIEPSQLGIAVIDEDLCIAFQGMRCEVCYRTCPLIDEAIVIDYRLREGDAIHSVFAPVIDDILFICDNGARTIYRGRVLNCYTIRRELAFEIIRDIEALPGCTTYVSALKNGYVKEGADELYRWLTEGYLLNITKLSRMPEDLPAEDGILGVEMYHPTAAEEIANQGLYQKWHGHSQLQVVCSGKQWVNFTPLNADKGIAVSEYQNSHGIQPSETMAFGDNMNDAGMLLRADLSYAIGNARKEIKSLTRFVADTNLNDGVLQVLRTIR